MLKCKHFRSYFSVLWIRTVGCNFHSAFYCSWLWIEKKYSVFFQIWLIRSFFWKWRFKSYQNERDTSSFVKLSSFKCKMCETKFKNELYLFLKRGNPLNVTKNKKKIEQIHWLICGKRNRLLICMIQFIRFIWLF